MSDLEQHLNLLENVAASPLDRRAAAAALSGSSDHRAREALRRATKDLHWPVRAEAVRALREVPAMVEAWSDPVFAVREQGISFLADLDNLEELVPLLEGTYSRLRGAAATALGRLGGNAAARHLMARLPNRLGFGGEPDKAVLKVVREAIEQIKIRAAAGGTEGLAEPSQPKWKKDFLPRPPEQRR